jgi:trimeric autotransporter adhesin
MHCHRNSTGLVIDELSRSNTFIDAENSGKLHRTAWAGFGSGVLFFDPAGTGAITQKNQYVFTEWDPTARGDLEALRNVFDSNGDGVLNASDAKFALFKVMVTNADGWQTAKTLTQLGITQVNLKADLTHIQYSDGSEVTGQTTFTRSNGTTGTVANTALAAETGGYAVTQTVTVDGVGTRTLTNTALAEDGSIASVTTPDVTTRNANQSSTELIIIKNGTYTKTNDNQHQYMWQTVRQRRAA